MVKAQIRVQDLKVSCIIGKYLHERKSEQNLLFDLNLYVDITEAAEKDELKKTIDYAELTKWLRDQVRASSFNLIETLAVRLLEGIMIRWDEILECTLTVKKPGALAEANHASVTVSQKREV